MKSILIVDDQNDVRERAKELLRSSGLLPHEVYEAATVAASIEIACAHRPDMILLDEPTAGQDLKHYTEIMDFLVQLNKQGVTVVLITHDMHLMLEYTDRAVVIAEGELLADDTPANILTNEEIAAKAYLKKTSLYDLAVKCDITEPSALVDRFIYFEKSTKRSEWRE